MALERSDLAIAQPTLGITRARRATVRRAAALVARLYFDVSYGLLTGSVAGRRILALAADGNDPVHGYFTVQDREALLDDLDLRPGERLLDLGCGIGGIALELHRRSGAEITGVDISARAVSAATRRAQRAGVAGSVAFVAGDLARPPSVGAASAYAVDSLMFVPDLAGTLRGIGDVLGHDGRLFATLLVAGHHAEARLRHSLQAAGARVERLDDVTSALGARNRIRVGAARAVRLGGPMTPRGRLAIRLVLGEEALLGWLIANNQVSRWRFVVRYERGKATRARG